MRGHEHHNVTEIDTGVPFDSVIWVHVSCCDSPRAVGKRCTFDGVDRQMSLQTFVWAISFPIGMVLGLSK